MLNLLAQALMQQPNDAQLAQLQQQQNGPMGGLFGSYGQFQPVRALVQQSLQARDGAFNPAGSTTPYGGSTPFSAPLASGVPQSLVKPGMPQRVI